MSKVNWVIDEYILDSPSTVGDLPTAITNAGHNLHTTKYVPFAEDQDYGPDEFLNQPTILYGTCGWLRRNKKGLIPGAYGFANNLNCNVYYAHIPNEWLLNYDFIMLPFDVIRKNPEKIFSQFGHDMFIRPNSGFKTFAGMTISLDDFDFEMNSTQQLSSVMPETICIVSSVKELKAEFRFIVVGGEVVDGSEYRWDNILDIRHDYDQDCWNLAQMMAEYSWQPDSIYTCDVALTADGPKIIELNSFAAAGLYAMDRNIVVDKVSTFAWNDFHNI